jgi:hypothetical protein
VVFLFRDPVEHAYSLMKQHQRFERMQEADPFVLEYMDWLGHHEFGKGMRKFSFADGTMAEGMAPQHIEHWVRVWTVYYTRLLAVTEGDADTILVDYDALLRSPEAVVDRIGHLVGVDLGIKDIDRFQNTNRYEGHVAPEVLVPAQRVFEALKARSVR